MADFTCGANVKFIMADFTYREEFYLWGGFYSWGKFVILNGLWGKCVIHNGGIYLWGKCVIHNGGFY